jgi:hypothetical protein
MNFGMYIYIILFYIYLYLILFGPGSGSHTLLIFFFFLLAGEVSGKSPKARDKTSYGDSYKRYSPCVDCRS